ncbi:MAG: endonuclease III [Bdellovibrionales bacterium GWB1_55_8]|nr:MAG: endonuclease III [Bdellovibrionales bacterium GWB1_55_8]
MSAVKVSDSEKKRVAEVIRVLEREYPEAACSLDFKNPFQLLVATVLSAQCTDKRVNLITPEIFRRFPDAHAMAKAKLSELERLVKSTGFYKNKAKALKKSAAQIAELHHGKVPGTREELVKLPGVGRKTANVILGNAFGIATGIAVDTHVGRVSRRLGLTASKNPEIVERELLKLVPEKHWIHFSHLLIQHGREICSARRAYCERCPISRFCPKVGVTPPVGPPGEWV